MTAPSPAQQSLPVTLDWYRQGANWLVGLASGVVAANLALVDKITGAAFWVEVVDGIALFLLLLVVVAGVFFYWWLTTYGNKREKESSLEEELARETDPAQKASLEKKIQEAQQRMALAQTAFANWYKVLLWCFPLGLAALAIVTIALLFSSAPAATAEKWAITAVPCCVARCRLQQPHVLLLNESTGQTWYLTMAKDSAMVWRGVVRESTAKKP